MPSTVGDQIDHARPAGGIGVCRNNSDWLVDHVVDEFRLGKWLAIDADFLLVWICFRAKRGDDATVDFHTASENQFFAVATATKTCRSKDFLQPLAIVR